MIPTALYTGAIAFNKIFNLEVVFGISYSQAIVYTVVAIGAVGAIYAILGGLKAVAVSDTLNAFILVIGALLVPIFALIYLGEGSFTEGFKIITTTHVEKFNAIGSATDAVPWPAMFTGILIVNFFYWTTNQAIVQRALGARDLKAGQKGILIAALFLLALPLILNVPGLLSFHILGEGLNPIDTSYPELVNKVLPTALQGFFIAALFGAILSTFNSFLNSAATIYCKDLLPSISKKVRTEKELVSYAKKVSAIMAILTMIIGPLLMFGKDDVVLDNSFFKPLEGKPGHYRTISKMWGMWQASEESWKEVITKFWGYITLIDDAIGELLDFLEQKQLYDSTFLVATADHGDAMGAHRMIEKGEFMFDTTYNIPMIIKDPLSNRANQQDDNLVYLHDLTSTVYDIANQTIPDSFEGETLLPITRNGRKNDRKGVLGQLAGHFVYFEQRMWRRKDYKLVFNAADKCELYDIRHDPEEMHNLFYDERYQAIKKELLEEMRAEMKRLGDPLENWLYRIIDEV